MDRLEVKEQPPVGGSIFCEARVVARREDGSVYAESRFGNNMYFVVNRNKKVIQYFDWLLDYKDDLKELGYKL